MTCRRVADIRHQSRGPRGSDQSQWWSVHLHRRVIEDDLKQAPQAHGTLNVDSTVMGFGDLTHQSQPDSHPCRIGSRSTVHLLEPVKNAAQSVVRNAFSVVQYGQGQPPAPVPTKMDLDMPARRGELESIRDQIEQRRLQSDGIYPRRQNVPGKNHLERQAPGASHAGEAFLELGKPLANVQHLAIHLRDAELESLQVQKLFALAAH